MDDRVVGPLRELRGQLHDGLRQLQVAAASIGEAEDAVSQQALDGALAYLEGVLLPYFGAEEFTMFIAIDGVIGTTGASNIMVAQHGAIREMVDDLRKVADAAREAGSVDAYARYLVPLLHGLYAAVRLHLESEDDAYLPLLDDHLSESQVGVIRDNLERIATKGGAAPEGQMAGVNL
ncbi:MAG: hemerythrin domain-containing protein [Dehalococcoidia bacterium]|nr:hemerythrin domain-containing protein [Dehalococcoidia bacterium]